jgi:hypothetical protein
MKKLQSSGRYCMLLLLYIGFISCNKEPLSEQKTGEEQVRILRVERNSGTYKGAPFFNDNSGAVLYEYDNTGRLKTIKVYTDHSYQQANQILEYDVIHQAGIGNSTIEFIRRSIQGIDPITGFFIEELRIALKNSTFESSFYTTKTYFNNVIYTFTSNTLFSTKYTDPRLNESCSESNAQYGESNPETHRKLLRSSCFQTGTSGRITSIFKTGNTYRFATNELLDEDRYYLEEIYEYYNDDFLIPKGLIKHINGAIFGAYYFGMEESYNLFTINSVTSPPENSNNNTAFQDWIFLFGLPQTLDGNRHQLIKSKRIQGEKNVGFEGFENTYIFNNMDSTATFPYTHDPIAKTLEIAGLKIWYEVVE